MPDKPGRHRFVGHTRLLYNLSKEQAALYQQSVNELVRQLEIVDDGMKRRGLVLTYLMRFKQICNHSDQYNFTSL